MTHRRQFLKKIVRTLLLALIGGGVVWGLQKEKVVMQGGADCAVNESCGQCSKYNDCNDKSRKTKVERQTTKDESRK